MNARIVPSPPGCVSARTRLALAHAYTVLQVSGSSCSRTESASGATPPLPPPAAKPASTATQAAPVHAVGGGATDPAALSDAELPVVHALVRPADEARESRVFTQRPWRGHRDSWVVLSSKRVAPGASPKALDAELAVVERRDGQLALVAKGGLSFESSSCGDTESPYPDALGPVVSLDLAPYALSEGDTAIGVRLACDYATANGDGRETRLYLHRLREGKLSSVFDVEVDVTETQNGPEGGEYHVQHVVVMAPEKHEGLFDILVRHKREPGEPKGQPARPAGRYVYTDGSYHLSEAPAR